MPLIYCPDCGNQCSTEAPNCPHCGRPMGVRTPSSPPPFAQSTPAIPYQQTPVPPVPPVTAAPPKSWLAESIIATILCCWPLGIPAIVYAAKVDKLWTAGRHEESLDASNKAKIWTIVSAALGLVAFPIALMMGFFGAILDSL